MHYLYSMNPRFFIVLLLVLLSGKTLCAQTIRFFEPVEKQGHAWFFWGYNRSAYTNSDIHFKGTGYEYTLHDVEARDAPSEWDPEVYLNIKQFTVPQFNIRAGYFFKRNYSLSLGWDHMKYKLINNQESTISGYIDQSVSSHYGGTYDNDPFKIYYGFLAYEHTDGLNYIRFQLDRLDNLVSIGKDKVRVQWLNGIGLAALMPWTDARWLGTRYENKLHLAGFGFNGSTSVRLELLGHVFGQLSYMGGYINLLDVTVNRDSDDRAKQTFWFYQRYIVAGLTFNLNGK